MKNVLFLILIFAIGYVVGVKYPAIAQGIGL